MSANTSRTPLYVATAAKDKVPLTAYGFDDDDDEEIEYDSCRIK